VTNKFLVTLSGFFASGIFAEIWFKFKLNLPVILSDNIREVMILPYESKIASRSGWVIFFGKPDTYKFAPLIDSLDGRANETCGSTTIVV
jgi:hypothetical protein